MKRLTIIMYFCSLFFVPLETKADEFDYKDEDYPISFDIEVLPWEQAKNIIPKGTKFIVIDVETGQTFQVQRRAGRSHADVQPITKKDTKIMKEIYDGKWSWRRRAILVKVNDQFIAASMHGMPHGAGALRNGFPGHFCIHFLGSTTHRSGKMDPLHHLMVLKAGGKEEEFLYTVDPPQLIGFFVSAINYQDVPLMNLMVGPSVQPSSIKKKLKQFSYFRIDRMSTVPLEEGQLVLEVPVKVKYKTRKSGKVSQEMTFLLKRNSPLDRWIIDSENFFNQIK